jgi:transposase
VKGERPPGLCDRRFDWTYIFGAVHPEGDEGFALVLPAVSTPTMAIFLKAFSETLAPDVHVVMVLDQAGWHGANSLVVPDNITLVPLPPYSPELNPIERVWLFLRERFLSFRVFRDQDAIVEACCRAWNALVEEAGRIRSLCAQPWLPNVSS